MSTLTEISLASTKDAFLAAPEPIKRIPTLASLINLMHHTYQCSQTQTTPASATMTILFCAASPGIYSFFTNKMYPSSYILFLKEVDAVPDFTNYQMDN